jgi:hypothetical protein
VRRIEWIVDYGRFAGVFAAGLDSMKADRQFQPASVGLSRNAGAPTHLIGNPLEGWAADLVNSFIGRFSI